MRFRIRNLDHVVLRVRDMEAALAFYTGVLGCREERRLEEIRPGATARRREPDRPRARRPGTFRRQYGPLRACALTPFDESGLRAHLAEHGIETEAALPRYGAEGTGPSIYIRDPDGNTVELKGPPTGLGNTA